MTETQQKYCNAYVTHCFSGGHTKAARNEELASYWKAELERQGIAVPTDKQAAEFGQFNGDGSS